MNIIFLTNDEIQSIDASGIFTDLLRRFSVNGHTVYVVCANERRNNERTNVSIDNNVHVLRVKTGNITQVNMLEKGVSTLLVGYQFKKAINKHFKFVKFDLILYSTPPITLLSAVTYLKKRDGACTYLMLKDIFPQNAVDIGILKFDSLIYKHFRKVEKKFYDISDKIGCMSPANVNYLLKENVNIPKHAVEICPNTIDPLDINLSRDDISFIRNKYDIPTDKLVFIYGGNIGKPQDVNFIMECIEACTGMDFFFLIIGSGTDFYKLESYVSIKNPSNLKLIRKVPKQDYEMIVKASDVGLIFLDHRFTIPNFPSRILSYMQASLPVLAATDKNTDIGEIIKEGEFGDWCESKDPNVFVKKMEQFLDKSKSTKMGKNARRYLEENSTSQHAYEIIMKHFK